MADEDEGGVVADDDEGSLMADEDEGGVVADDDEGSLMADEDHGVDAGDAQEPKAEPPDEVGEADPIRGGRIHGTRPADGGTLPPVAVTSAAEVDACVTRAREAQRGHASRSLEHRARLLLRFGDALLSRGEALVAALRDETGKPEAEAWLHEVVAAADLARFWSAEGPAMLGAEEPVLDALDYPGKRAVVERLPRGVIALVTPWNFPVAIPLRTLFPALLAGNAVVLKPSEHTPRCGALVAEAAAEVFGDGLVGLAQGGGDVGAALLRAGVDAIVFTGSVATGRVVAAAAAEALVPVSLELGGKDAAIVLDDADVERAARGILWGAMVNAGQNCAGVERVYATPKVKAELCESLARLAGELVPGRDFGPLVTAEQLAVVERHVASAVASGATVLAGGERLERAGRWYAPTVLADVAPGNEALVEETFGPVVPVLEVPDADAAVAAANDSAFGLTASVWTRDLKGGERIARRLRAGTVMVNNHGFTGGVPSLPWSGVGHSGYGVTNSRHALDALTRPRTVLVDARRARREMWWHPYTPGLVRIGRAMATLRGGWAGVGARARAVPALLGGFVRRWKT